MCELYRYWFLRFIGLHVAAVMCGLSSRSLWNPHACSHGDVQNVAKTDSGCRSDAISDVFNK